MMSNLADDAMAILLAFQSPEVEIIGLTTIFGNVPTTLATQNALHLVCTACLKISFIHFGSKGREELECIWSKLYL